MSSSVPPQKPHRTPPTHPNTKNPNKATPPIAQPSPSKSNASLSPANSVSSSEATYSTPVKKPLHLLNDPPSSLKTPPQTPNTRRNVGKWKRGKLIGRGASGQVYIAHLISNPNKHIAVKQMQLGSHSNAEINSIQNEIDLLKNLNHANVVKYLGTESTELVLNIFLEYAPGGSLRQQLNTNWGKLNHKKAASCTYQILCGLNYLHEREVFHRDVKGANVLVSSSGRLQLTDFGASRRLGHDSVVSGLKGTPHWMAPEVIKGQQGDSGWAEADVWSVGCTVIEMLTAKMPWSEYPNPMAAMYHIANGEKPPLPEDVLSSITADCKSFIYEFCCCPHAKDRKKVNILLQHPWLTEAVEAGMMEVAEGGEGGAEAMLPGPVTPIGDKKGGGNEVVLASELENVGGEQKKKTRKLPKTPQNANSEADSETTASAAPPSLPKRPSKKNKKKKEKARQEKAAAQEAQEQGVGHQQAQEKSKSPARPLPTPTDRPLNRGSKTEREPESLKSNPAEQNYQTLEQQQEELRQMMEEQSQKIWRKQQEIDAQQELVWQQQRQQQQQEQQHLQQPHQPHPMKNSPRKQRAKERSLSQSSQNAQPSPRWTDAMGQRQVSNQPNVRNLQINTNIDDTSRPTGASAGLFVNNTNSYGRSSSSVVRQQAMEELTRANYQKNDLRKAVSAGVSGACMTPQAGLSRQLPPLQQLREHQIVDAQGGGTRMAVQMLPMRQIASAPTAVLQPVIDLLNAEKSSNRLIAPLGSSPNAIHDVEREEKKRRKERRREKQRLREEAMRRKMELAEQGML